MVDQNYEAVVQYQNKFEEESISRRKNVAEALSLLNSMIACGEQHSETSYLVLAKAWSSLGELS